MSYSLYHNKENLLNPFMDAEKQDSSTFEDLLVDIGQTKNRDSFIQLFKHFAPRIKSFLMKGGLSPEQADEVAQETLLTAWSKASSYDPHKAAASTWLFTIARNKRIDFLRKTARPAPDIHDPMFSGTEAPLLPDDQSIHLEEEKTLAAAILELPKEQAALIRQSFFEEKTHQDIAQETGLPLGTVKSRIRLALERLRHSLKGIER